MKLKAITIFSFLIISFPFLGQATLEEHIEIDEDVTNSIKLFSFQAQEKIVMITSDKANKNFNKKVSLLNSKLVPVQSKVFSREKRKGVYIEHDTDEEYYYNIITEKKNTSVTFNRISIPEFKTETYKFSLLPKSQINNWEVIKDHLILNLTIGKKKIIASVSVKTSKVTYHDLKNITGYKGIVTDIEHIKGKESDEVFVVYENLDYKNDQLHVFRFDDEGKKLSPWYFTKLENNLVSFTAYKKASGDYLVIGEYSGKSVSRSEGLYSAIITSSGQVKTIHYHNYLKIPHFLDYMSDKRAAKIEKKVAKKEKKGKELTYQFNVMKHDIIFDGEDYIFVGEFYHPTFRTERESYTTTVNGQTVTRYRTVSVFDGYQYTHALATSFSEEAQLKWSNVFDMYLAYKPMSPIKFITAELIDKKLKLLYTTGSNIHSKTLKGGSIVKNEDISFLSTENDSDKIKYTVGSTIKHWYGNKFLNYGFQKIKNEGAKAGHKKRKVYFINIYKY